MLVGSTAAACGYVHKSQPERDGEGVRRDRVNGLAHPFGAYSVSTVVLIFVPLSLNDPTGKSDHGEL